MSAYMPSEAEREAYGITVSTTKFWVAILGSALLSIQIFMVVYGLSVFLGTPRDQRKGRLRFIIISWIILLASGSDVMIDLWDISSILLAGGPSGISYLKAISAQYMIGQKVTIASDALLCVAIAVGDMLMLWRCLVLWKNKKWVVVLPIAVFLGSIVGYILLLVPEGPKPLLRRADIAIIASASLSVSMNIMVTFLILLKLGRTWLEVSRAFPERSRPNMYSDVMVIVVESALPLAVLGVFSIIAVSIETLHLPERPVERAKVKVVREVSGWLYYSFCALAPQMIIFRVTTGKTWKNAAETMDGMAAFSQPIQFARNGVESKVIESGGSV
ncbi:hypothetical protein BKA70DRAFT_1398279 [Coprinopsis sp. MPI-PUGE-AT-0042]|nr:hypothetical protein BKA70DRAFT_1398279 [Coprinopsis sp. MPI-PUGE-AT-0042]